MTDQQLIDAMLAHYHERTKHLDYWQPPALGTLHEAQGGFSDGPFGLAVRYALSGHGRERAITWLETSRMGGTSLWQRRAHDEDIRSLGAMPEGYAIIADPKAAAAARARRRAAAQAFWERARTYGLAHDLPIHTRVNAHLVTRDGDD